MEEEMGNQSVDLLWSSGEGPGRAETKITEKTRERAVIEFHRGVRRSYAGNCRQVVLSAGRT